MKPPVQNPRVRRDGTCYVCKGPRPDKAIEARDPFCSTACAKAHYGVRRSG